MQQIDRWRLLAGPVVLATGLGLVAGCSSGTARSADTTVAASGTTTATTTTVFDRAEAERQVRAAYQNFRVKLRELGRHPSTKSPIIDELYAPGSFMESVRAQQASIIRRGLITYPSARTRWKIESISFPRAELAVVRDCMVNGEVVKRGGHVVDDAANTYESELTFEHEVAGWRVTAGKTVTARKGVVGCALAG